MPECMICGVESDTLYKCKVCGDRFCEECGDTEQKLCLYCLEMEEDEDSGEGDWEKEEEEKDWR